MALVNGPLFSLDASGAVGKAIVYTKWKGRNVVREYVTPANPRSIAQRGRRTMMALLNAIWGTADTTDRESWADLAAAGNYSTFNGFTSYNLNQQTTSDPPTKNRSDTPSAINFLDGSSGAAGGVNRIDGTVDIDVTQAGAWVAISLAEGASAPGVDPLSMVAFVPAVTGGIPFAITDLPPGTYSLSAFGVTNDGKFEASPLFEETSLTVTGV